MIEIVLIAAVAENGVIGRDGVTPWRLKSDMRRFRALTVGRPGRAPGLPADFAILPPVARRPGSGPDFPA